MTSVTIHRRRVVTNGVELSVLEAGPADGPVVVLSHGFPELAYSWRHQLPVLAAAGYRAIAPDQRGYGGSTRPRAIEDYDITHLTDDLLGLLDDAGAASATFVGHDWGAMVVWQMSVLHSDRVDAVVGMSVPCLPRGPVPPIAAMRALFGESFFYIVYFQEPGVADADLGADPRDTITRLLCATPSTDPERLAQAFANDGRGFVARLPAPDGMPAWLSAEELDHYVTEFARTGFTGGLNWYRNLDRNWELTEHLAGAQVRVPSLFIGGAADPVLLLSPPAVMDGVVTDHRGTVLIDGAGHWVQQERPAEVNAALLTFLGGLGSDHEDDAP